MKQPAWPYLNTAVIAEKSVNELFDVSMKINISMENYVENPWNLRRR